MEISSNMPNIGSNFEAKEIRTNFKEKISKDDAQELKDQIAENANAVMFFRV